MAMAAHKIPYSSNNYCRIVTLVKNKEIEKPMTEEEAMAMVASKALSQLLVKQINFINPIGLD